MKNIAVIAALIAVTTLFAAEPAAAGAVKKKAKKASAAAKVMYAESITYPCSYDNSMQPALRRVAKTTDAPRPLFVVLHTWSSDYRQGNGYARVLAAHDVHMIAPNFRGRNTVGNKLAMGSDAAVSDVLDAVKYMQKNYKVDDTRIYLIGGSGGGFLSLLVSSRSREIWAAVSSWCPISDLVIWHGYRMGKGYSAQIEKTIGNPQKDPKAKAEALHRSPVTYLEGVKFPLDISHGISDKTVPVCHALYAFNKVAAPADRFTQAEIDFINDKNQIPESFPEVQEKMGKVKIHARRTSGNVRITVFDGGHSIFSSVGIKWLLKQQKGKPADFSTIRSNEKGAQLGR